MKLWKMGWMIAISAAISLVIVGGTLTGRMRQSRTTAESELATTTTAEEPGYLMKLEGDTIGLYRSNSTTPYQKLDMPTGLLSEMDYQMLQEGIYVATEAELRQKIEDITS